MLFTAGLGGMGGNQTRAMTMLGGVCVSVDADRRVIERRIEKGFCDVMATSWRRRSRWPSRRVTSAGRSGIGLIGNAAEVFPAVLERGWRPDIVTEMCPCHDPLSYIPAGLTPEQADELRLSDRDEYFRRARESMIAQLEAMIGFHDMASRYSSTEPASARSAATPACRRSGRC